MAILTARRESGPHYSLLSELSHGLKELAVNLNHPARIPLKAPTPEATPLAGWRGRIKATYSSSSPPRAAMMTYRFVRRRLSAYAVTASAATFLRFHRQFLLPISEPPLSSLAMSAAQRIIFFTLAPQLAEPEFNAYLLNADCLCDPTDKALQK
ncbi:hypothetical protein F5X98DRAFT_373888 [Xylaria grammica]|nr:hypothetical protein F5X98DRAFT_373888 [Xylaria grammica]